jgi:hypothetical protein
MQPSACGIVSQAFPLGPGTAAARRIALAVELTKAAGYAGKALAGEVRGQLGLKGLQYPQWKPFDGVPSAESVPRGHTPDTVEK